MIEVRTEHEECSDCTHTYELHITEGPQTRAAYEQSEMLKKLYMPMMQQMLNPIPTLGTINDNRS